MSAAAGRGGGAATAFAPPPPPSYPRPASPRARNERAPPAPHLCAPAQIERLAAAAAGGAPPGSTVISLTPSEAAAVERLQSLGFSKQRALEAFLACDKNEEMAANYLFESGE